MYCTKLVHIRILNSGRRGYPKYSPCAIPCVCMNTCVLILARMAFCSKIVNGRQSNWGMYLWLMALVDNKSILVAEHTTIPGR